MDASAYPHLSDPITIGGLELRNRVFVPAHSTNFAERLMSERLVQYYLERAQAGVALIVQEPAIVHPSSLSRPTKVWAYDAENIPHLRRAADAVHGAGAKIFCQLIHNGAHMGHYFSGMPVWAPSEFFDSAYGEHAHEMTGEEIDLVVEGFATSAANVEAAGYDGVEIHGSHGYLIQEFLSPLTNHRTDDYGGSFENRLRLLRRVIAAIRAQVAPSFVVGVRLAGTERAPGGLTEADAVAVVGELETDGGLDFVDVVSGSLAAEQWIVPDGNTPRSLNAAVAAQIRATTTIPVLVAGRIAEPAEAEAILAEGQADLVGLVRPLIADPQWLAKATSGAAQTIRTCTYCNECSNGIVRYRPIHCTVNPDMGHEEEARAWSRSRPPTQATRVVVVGGGPAGMECALTASSRGHDVVLLEAGSTLGGQLRLGQGLVSRFEVTRIADHLASMLSASKVAVGLGVGGTAESISGLAPDLVVLATGSKPILPDVEGAELVLSADAVLLGNVEVGRRVVVCEHPGADWAFDIVLEHLAVAGHEVVAVTAGPSLVPRGSDRGLLARLVQAGVTLVPWHRAMAFTAGSVQVRHTLSGEDSELTADSIVLAMPRTSRSSLAVELGEEGIATRTIGDGLAPRGLYEAIADGRRVARLVGAPV